jgi:ATP-binding cassette, subfamily G (WHITE), member 2, PDR
VLVCASASWFVDLMRMRVLVSPNDLPDFWIFVYRASPLTYFINGMVVATLANTKISCSDLQLLHIDPPSHVSSNVTCGDYLGPFVQFAGGSIVNSESTTDCHYCPVSESNRLLKQLGMETLHPWHNVGYMTVYVIFNTLAVYAIYWLFRVVKASKRGQEL